MSPKGTKSRLLFNLILYALSFQLVAQQKEVVFKIVINGKGKIITDQSPPYSKGQTITVSFYPSGGNQFISKPDVLVTSPGDSLFGWVFDHWSVSPSSKQEQSGLDNPLSITLNNDTTFYVSFIHQGTVAHLTDVQHNQLMNLRAGEYKGWQSISPEQQSGLYYKAENYLSDFINYNELWGQPATVWWKNFKRNEALGYDYLGEGVTWSGLHLTALTLKYSLFPDDIETTQAIIRVLQSIDRNTLITGFSGRVARFSGPTENEAYHWYYKNVKVGASQGVAPYQDMTWLGKPTRDTHTGLFTGLASVVTLCKNNNEIFDLAKKISERVVDQLIKDKWKIKGQPTGYYAPNEKSLKQLQMRVAYEVNPEKYKDFEKKIDGYNLRLNKGKNLYSNLYWVEWMTWARVFGILMLEKSPQHLDASLKKVNTLFEHKKMYFNPYYVGVTCYLNSLTNQKLVKDELNKIMQAELEGLLLAYPDGIKWNREVNLFQDPRFTVHNEKFVKEAALPNQVYNADFNAQRSAARGKGGSNRQSYQFTNFDMYLTYWLACASGRLSVPKLEN